MYGQFTVLGPRAHTHTADALRSWWRLPANLDLYTEVPNASVATFSPLQVPVSRLVVTSADGRLRLSVDGYLLCDGLPASVGQPVHLQQLADLIRAKGILAALSAIRGGAYNLVGLDSERNLCYLANDHLAAIPLYYGKTENGCLISSSPVAIARSGQVEGEIDPVAIAEWALVGYTIGARYFLKSMRMLDPYVCLIFDIRNNLEQWFDRGRPPIYWEDAGERPSPRTICEKFEARLEDLSRMDTDPALLLSSGKDSRLILAAWPQGHNPVCYSYGNPESHEIEIARQAAALRGSRWEHVWYHGDEVAGHLESMFDAGGQIVFPDRFMAAHRMSEDGHTGVLDGFMGDIWLGYSYGTDSNLLGGWVPRVTRYFAKFVDQRISRIGLPFVSEQIYRFISEHDLGQAVGGYCDPEFIRQIERQKDDVMTDIETGLRQHMPSNDSLGHLVRNFFLANRSARSISLQGVMCRSAVNIYYPFSDSLEFVDFQRKLTMRYVGYNNALHAIFRKYYPDFGKILYGSSLIPLGARPIRHLLSRQLQANGLPIPYLAGNNKGRVRDANSWGIWLRESERMRAVVQSMLRSGGIVDEDRTAATLRRIGDGTQNGSGKVFHLAGLSTWISLAQKVKASKQTV